jgi:YfiR/HmsC-like
MRESFQTRRMLSSLPCFAPVSRAFVLRRIVLGLAVFSFFGVSFFAACPACSQVIDREYTLKAAYLYKFATYIEWPERAFRDAESPFVIGILGPDMVGGDLRKIAAVKKIAGRRIEVTNYERLEEVDECHILFLPRGLEVERQQAAIKMLSGKNVLLVGEDADFLKHGGVVDFAIQENRIRIHISQPAYEREELEVSAQLLRIAVVTK